ncbi:AraC family transcriptional regulator [Hoeflea alexandrii]|uniref:AraC family transcriptional regulator n=1 Tax=Hoeflea alexandrii TaxID=288436 RepID=UPI0022AEFE2A|nr:helix-turn-helix domain-containing protein [Hoeflea alexandrii]
MLNYASKHWDENESRSSDYRSLLFSAPGQFNMTRDRNRCLRVSSAQFPVIGVSLLSVVSSGHEIDLADDSFLTVMLPTRGLTKVRMDRREQVIGEGTALALGPSERWTRVDRLAHRDFRANLAKISLKKQQRLGILPKIGEDPVVPIASTALAGLRGLMDYLFADLKSSAPTLVHRPASDLFAALVLEHIRCLFAVATDTLPMRSPQHGLVGSAIDYMVAHSSEPLTVPIIARAVGVSVRQLQDAFRMTLGQTPWERLTAHRLENARAQLLSGGTASVTGVALGCGFSHLGRFATTYRSTYGEPPSATLARARGASSAIRIAPTQNG